MEKNIDQQQPSLLNVDEGAITPKDLLSINPNIESQQKERSPNHSPQNDRYLQRALLQENYLELSIKMELKKLKQQISSSVTSPNPPQTSNNSHNVPPHSTNKQIGMQIRTSSQISEINSLIKKNLNKPSSSSSYTVDNNNNNNNNNNNLNNNKHNLNSGNQQDKGTLNPNSAHNHDNRRRSNEEIQSPYFPKNSSVQLSQAGQKNPSSVQKVSNTNLWNNNSISSLQQAKEINKTQESKKLYENFAQTYREVSNSLQSENLQNQNYPSPRREKHNGYLPGQMSRKFQEDRMIPILYQMNKRSPDSNSQNKPAKTNEQNQDISNNNSSVQFEEGKFQLEQEEKLSMDLDKNNNSNNNNNEHHNLQPKIAIDSSKIFKNLRGPLFYQQNNTSLAPIKVGKGDINFRIKQNKTPDYLQAKRRNSMEEIKLKEFSKNPHDLISDNYEENNNLMNKSKEENNKMNYENNDQSDIKSKVQFSARDYNLRNPDHYMKMLLQYANPPTEDGYNSSIKKQRFFSQLSVPSSPDKEKLYHFNRLKYMSQTKGLQSGDESTQKGRIKGGYSYMGETIRMVKNQDNVIMMKRDGASTGRQKQANSSYEKKKENIKLTVFQDKRLKMLMKTKAKSPPHTSSDSQNPQAIINQDFFKKDLLSKTYNLWNPPLMRPDSTGYRSQRSRESRETEKDALSSSRSHYSKQLNKLEKNSDQKNDSKGMVNNGEEQPQQQQQLRVVKYPTSNDVEHTGHVKFLRENKDQASQTSSNNNNKLGENDFPFNEVQSNSYNLSRGENNFPLDGKQQVQVVEEPNYGEPSVPQTLNNNHSNNNQIQTKESIENNETLPANKKKNTYNQMEPELPQKEREILPIKEETQQEANDREGNNSQKQNLKKKQRLTKKQRLQLNEFRNIMETYNTTQVFINSKGINIQN